MRIYIHCAKPGMIIGRDGTEIEKLRADVEKMAGVPVSLNVIAVKPVEMSAQLVAENIASQLERRIVLPPRNEAGYRPHHAHGRKGYKDRGFRTSGRRRDRSLGALS